MVVERPASIYGRYSRQKFDNVCIGNDCTMIHLDFQELNQFVEMSEMDIFEVHCDKPPAMRRSSASIQSDHSSSPALAER